jgi:hypothetical protein
MDYRCRHHHNVDAEGEGTGDELRVLITVFAFLASAWYSVVQYRKEKHFRS